MNFITVKVHSAIAAVCCKALRSCERRQQNCTPPAFGMGIEECALHLLSEMLGDSTRGVKGEMGPS